jgi:thiol-disulfide isomerase/thioredoxin
MIWLWMSLLVLCAGLTGYQSATAGIRDLYAAAGMKEVTEQHAAPAFVLTTIAGESIDSASLRGKVVLVNFWATWCGPCKEEMPALERLKESFSGKNLELLAVTTDEQLEGIRGFVHTLGLEFPVLLDNTKDVSAAFGVRGLPTTVVIGKDGRMLAKAVGPRRWDGPESIALIHMLLESAPMIHNLPDPR